MKDDFIENLRKKTADALSIKKLTISLAESCTGGLVSSIITSIAGSSDYFKGAVIAYSNEIKINILNVEKSLIDEFGAVSPQTASAMALGIKTLMKTDLALSITGIAGPSGGTSTKPIGLVYICAVYGEKEIVEKLIFSGTRTEIQRQASFEALKLICKIIGV